MSEKGKNMANKIDDDMLEYVGILAKLELEGEDREHARKDMEQMLDYIDMLNELDTSDVEPMVQAIEVENVFREDEITNGDARDEMLANAPVKKNGQYEVPRTF